MKVTIAQISPKLKKITPLEFVNHLSKVDPNTQLVIFPELALNGYLLKDAVFEDAYTLEEIEQFAALATPYDLVFGAIIKENHKFYNSSIYCESGKIKHIHHKSALPNYGLFQEARFFFKGTPVDAFETRFGKTFVAICEELYDAKTIAEITEHKPDLVIVISNSPARGFSDEGLLIQKQWDALLGTTALLSGANVIFANRVGFEDGLGFWGGSCFISPKGTVECRAPLFEEAFLMMQINTKLSQTQKYLLRGYE
ncbi:nitrilase-related carbon-nitrogen hydrolase [Sulfurospirillum sp. 1612]|uniref:nitrilase-related carbon-nitrogen hydrolase n=1 Tax=Sulfurospirillum sp. 1612 TaxID=3094835 RepID=UPI002F93F681